MAREQLVSSSLFNCEFCDYTSPKRYNYIRHLMCKHNVCNSLKYTNNLQNNTMDLQNNTIDLQNNTIDLQNNTIDLQNNTMDLPNNTMDLPNHTLEHNQKEIPFKCQACYKILTTKYTLQRHLTKCKGIKHPFECQYCHKTYKQQQHKSRHETKCLLVHQAKMQQAEHIGTQIINNTTNNNINTTNNNINNINNTTINNNLTINLVAFPKEKNRLVPFLSDHLDAKAIAAIFGNPAYLMDGFKEYSKAIIKRPENNIVIKQNLRDSRSKVHIGDNKWEMLLDKDILPIITDSITSEAAHQLEFSGAQDLINKTRYKACEKLFNSILSPDSEDYKENYKNASEKIKYVILNESYKDKLNQNPNK